jgi:hypothetical protein
MKITHLIAAALMVFGIGATTEASAQRYDGAYSQEIRYDRNDRDRRNDRRWDRRDDRRWDRRDDRRGNRGWSQRNNGRHYGWRNGRGGRNNCRLVYRHGNRYTVCR